VNVKTLEWSRCHPWPVADGLVTRYAETGVVVARARFLSPSVYMASGDPKSRAGLLSHHAMNIYS
jgi:choline dehydrogenase-like flavoprotein